MVNGALLLLNSRTAIRFTRFKGRRTPTPTRTHHLLCPLRFHTKNSPSMHNHRTMKPIMEGISILHYTSVPQYHPLG
jgi:hypothetical protein